MTNENMGVSMSKLDSEESVSFPLCVVPTRETMMLIPAGEAAAATPSARAPTPEPQARSCEAASPGLSPHPPRVSATSSETVARWGPFYGGTTC